MNKTETLAIFVCLPAIVIAFSSCGNNTPGAEQARSRNESERAVSVRIEEVRPTSFEETIQLTGVVKAADDIIISAEEGGVLQEWRFRKGEYVKQGEIIAVLRDDVLKASHEAAAAQYHIAELNYSKQEKVYGEQAISELQFKNSGYARDAAKAQAELMRARWDRTRIRSPVSGILDERFVDAGELTAPGVPVARVVNINKIKLQINVPERYAGTVTVGAPVYFTVIAYPAETFKGKISYVGSALSPDNRTFPVELSVHNSGWKLKPEMIAKARIVQAVQRKAILLEENVVQQIDRSEYVVYVANGTKAEQRKVELGSRSSSKVEIIAGLNAGDRVVVSGYQNLVDGQPIRVIQ